MKHTLLGINYRTIQTGQYPTHNITVLVNYHVTIQKSKYQNIILTRQVIFRNYLRFYSIIQVTPYTSDPLHRINTDLVDNQTMLLIKSVSIIRNCLISVTMVTRDLLVFHDNHLRVVWVKFN